MEASATDRLKRIVWSAQAVGRSEWIPVRKWKCALRALCNVGASVVACVQCAFSMAMNDRPNCSLEDDCIQSRLMQDLVFGAEYPLHKAAEVGSSHLATSTQAQLGCCAADADDQLNTPLHVAAREGHAGVLLHLLATHTKTGGKIRNNPRCERQRLLQAVNAKGEDVLVLAAANGHATLTQLLLAEARRLDVVLGSDAALFRAIADNHSDCVLTLLREGGVDAGSKNVRGETVLHVALRSLRRFGCADAVSMENAEIIHMLVQHPEVDIDAEYLGLTAVQVALDAGFEQLHQLLLDNGATPLHQYPIVAASSSSSISFLDHMQDDLQDDYETATVYM